MSEILKNDDPKNSDNITLDTNYDQENNHEENHMEYFAPESIEEQTRNYSNHVSKKIIRHHEDHVNDVPQEHHNDNAEISNDFGAKNNSGKTWHKVNSSHIDDQNKETTNENDDQITTKTGNILTPAPDYKFENWILTKIIPGDFSLKK